MHRARYCVLAINYMLSPSLASTAVCDTAYLFKVVCVCMCCVQSAPATFLYSTSYQQQWDCFSSTSPGCVLSSVWVELNLPQRNKQRFTHRWNKQDVGPVNNQRLKCFGGTYNRIWILEKWCQGVKRTCAYMIIWHIGISDQDENPTENTGPSSDLWGNEVWEAAERKPPEYPSGPSKTRGNRSPWVYPGQACTEPLCMPQANKDGEDLEK